MGGGVVLLVGEIGSRETISGRSPCRPTPRCRKPLSPDQNPGIHKGAFPIHHLFFFLLVFSFKEILIWFQSTAETTKGKINKKKSVMQCKSTVFGLIFKHLFG